MFLQQNFKNWNMSLPSQRIYKFIDRDFQIRYMGMVVSASLLGGLIAGLPIYYYLDQNYIVFIELAQQYSPQIITHLERERVWVSSLLIISFSGLAAFFMFLSYKLTGRIIGPLRVLRNHLRQMSRGKWFLPPVKVRQTDEFQDLIDSYNYFYESFRTHLRQDLELLKKLKVDQEHRESYFIWKSMIEDKTSQLEKSSERV
ncbi:MAG: hypothetical protein K1X29_06415 [Bdellovibrionales bacterium]|nr:hypothetical protein [Bdellovibrionales bacterium]